MTVKLSHPDQITIRAAIASDVDAIQRMCMNLLASQSLGIPIDEQSLKASFQFLQNNPEILFQVGIVDNEVKGVIVGHLSQALWNQKVTVAKLLFWYVQPRYYNLLAPQLLSALEDWAKGRAAVCLMTTCLKQRSSQKMRHFFEMHDYSLMEYLMVKRLALPPPDEDLRTSQFLSPLTP